MRSGVSNGLLLQGLQAEGLPVGSPTGPDLRSKAIRSQVTVPAQQIPLEDPAQSHTSSHRACSHAGNKTQGRH